MIDTALELVRSELNGHLVRRFGGQATDTLAELGGVHDPAAAADTLRLTLVRIEEERVVKSQTATRRTADQQVEPIEPELKLNLFVLVSGSTHSYVESLKRISAAVGFFQAHPVFNAANTPSLPSAIEKLLVELHSPTFEETNHVFGMLTAAYRPAVLYRIRLVTIQESAPGTLTPPVRSIAMEGVKA